MNTRDTDVAVVGAGLAGCLLACFLTRRGYQVTLYERRGDPRTGEPERGRSINLAISERGIDALRRVGKGGGGLRRAALPPGGDGQGAGDEGTQGRSLRGRQSHTGGGLADQVLAAALPMRGRMIHPVAGELDLQPYSADRQRAINSVGRAALNRELLAAATGAGAQVRFDHRLVGLDPASGEMKFETPSGSGAATAGVVLGADGAGSAVRGQLLAHDLLTERLDFLGHGYKELTIPPRNGEFALDPGALHIWPRGSSMMIALPNPDRSFTCTLFWPIEPTASAGSDATEPHQHSFASLATPAAIERHFATHYPDVPPLAPELVADYQHNPVGSLGTVYCQPWQAYGRVGLIGDAAHAIVPFYGQGANCAFEDVVELDRCLTDTGDDWARALPEFERRRRENTDAIAEMALDNFVEMRDKVASPVYQARKRVEHALERTLPGRYVSRYELVSFTTIPYAQVRRRVRRQQWILGGLLAGSVAAGAAGVAAIWRWRR